MRKIMSIADWIEGLAGMAAGGAGEVDLG